MTVTTLLGLPCVVGLEKDDQTGVGMFRRRNAEEPPRSTPQINKSPVPSENFRQRNRLIARDSGVFPVKGYPELGKFTGVEPRNLHPRSIF